MKNILSVLFGLFTIVTVAQNGILIKSYPRFEACKEVSVVEEQSCFRKAFQQALYANYEEPDIISEEEYEGSASLIFEVDKEGIFQIIYIEADFDEVKQALQQAFDKMPKLEPATYDGKPTYFQFRTPLRIPLRSNYQKETKTETIIQPQRKSFQDEYQQIINLPYQNKQTSSALNIPLSHEFYNRFDSEMNLIGTNAHTSSKPFKYSEVKPYYDIAKENEKLFYDKESWFGRKFFNENTARIQGEDYWFTFDIAADLQIGRDAEENFTTYNNTRAGIIQGGLGEKLNFYSVIYESQGKFAGYYNDLARSLGREGTNSILVPGRGIGESFRGSGFDYPVVEGYLNYEATNFLDLQFGTGKNFIGDGYRSLFLSDNASPNAYFKMNTTFWKFKYTSIWSAPRNLNTLTEGGAYTTKYMATHYLSYNVTERLNIGLFETALFESEPNRGFDWNFLNPVIFYNMVEYATGTRSGKSMIGLSYKYKWSNKFNTYGQVLIDELSVEDVTAMNKSWKNKFGLQLGFKYFDAFKVKNLYFQMEYNQVRPYTYSHNTLSLHYTHNNQSMAHLWGANFREIMLIARYKKDRFYGHAKFILGERGFEPFADSNPFYGSDLFGDERDRVGDTEIEIGQGNKANSYYGELEVGYIVNPTTNLKVYLNLIQRKFDIAENNSRNFDRNTSWLNLGFRTDIFNWYYDY